MWTLKVVMNHLSFRSCKDLAETFHIIFPDSAIANKSALSPAKVAYTIVHGLAPYFEEESCNEKLLLSVLSLTQSPYQGQVDNILGVQGFLFT